LQNVFWQRNQGYNSSAFEEVTRMPRYLTALALVLSALPLLCHGQSLGDVAREVRADRQTSGSPQVITNDDLVLAVPSRDTSQKAVSSSTTEANRTGTPAEVATPGERAGKDSAKGREARELEIQRRTDEINQRYIDHIALLRAQINTAQVELVKLEGSYQNRWVVEQQYHKPDWDFRKNQILAFNQHITDLTETQRKLIDGMKSQLAGLQEEARRAGVPHATD